MEKKRLSVEEEFLNYGETNSGSYGNGAKQSAQVATGGSFSKLIQVLIILVLLAVLVVLGIIGYMYAKKAFVAQGSQKPVVQERVVAKQEQIPQQIASTSSSMSGAGQQNLHKKAVQTQEVVQQQTVQSQPQQPQIVQPQIMQSQAKMQAAPKVAETPENVQKSTPSVLASSQLSAQQKVQQQEQKVSAPPKPEPTTQQAAPAKTDLKTMSDEELIEYLKSLKPDQLKNLDIEQLILSRKSEKSTANVKVAKTEYLNNQLVLIQKPETQKKSEIAQLSQKLSSLIKEEKRKTPKNSYVQKLQKEITTRQKSIRYYVVQPGDTLSKIAKDVYGSVKAYVKIYEANQDIVKDPNLIYPGQKLRIPSI